MPAKRRLTMRQLRQMLRLAGSGTSSREIAVVLGVARSTVQDNLTLLRRPPCLQRIFPPPRFLRTQRRWIGIFSDVRR